VWHIESRNRLGVREAGRDRRMTGRVAGSA
jgi:hypothetical protein